MIKTGHITVAILAILLFSQTLTATSEKQLVLTERGQAKASIVVIPDAGKVAAFAARELKKYLDKSTGADFKIINKVPESGIALLIGDSAESRKAGVDVKNLKRDGFIIKCTNNKIIIAGRDDKSYNIVKDIKAGQWRRSRPECATVFGVYDFLERVVGVRWYFPGKYGEFCPKKKKLIINRLNIKEEPANRFRWAHMYSSRYKKDRKNRFHDYLEMGISDKDTVLWVLRNKVSTAKLPFNHMPSTNNFVGRFGEKHPDWFALRNGNRLNKPVKRASMTKMCYSSKGLRAEITKDADAYFAGKSSNTRGLKFWHPAVAAGDYYSLEPNDAFRVCECKDCQAQLNKNTNCSELIWGYVADIAQRLKGKYPKKYLTCLAYPPYLKVPETVKNQGNVIAGVTLGGPCGARGGDIDKWQVDLIKSWRNFTGKKVVLWTYNASEVVGYRSLLSGVPKLELKAMGRFYKSVKDNISGVFYENEIEYGFQNHLDLYIFQRVTWNPDADVKKILQEYCRNMYGPAASDVYGIIDKAEDLWMKKITSPTFSERHQRYGASIAVNAKDMWTDVYSPAEMKKLRKLIKQAESKTQGTEYASRFQLFKRRFFSPLERKCAEFNSRRESMKNSVQATVPYFNNAIKIDGRLRETEWRKYNKKKIIVLKPFKVPAGQKRQITYLRYGWDNRNLYLMFSCEESSMDKIKSSKRSFDDTDIWLDDEIEIFLDPSNKRKGCYQILINASGSMADIKHTSNKRNKLWNSNAKIKVFKWKNPKSQKGAWYVEMAIPFTSLGGAPKAGDKWAANFCRSRRAETPNQINSWSPYIKDKFYQPEWFGTMTFEGAF